MNFANRYVNLSQTVNLFFRNKTQAKEWLIVASAVSRCDHCQHRQITSLRRNSNFRLKKKTLFHSFQPYVTLSKIVAKENQAWTLGDNACPQGIQGDIETDSTTFKLWLENCHRYGLENCDQQLQGIQSGRKTIAEVMAEQEKLIADIAEEYRKQNKERRLTDSSLFPDINTPCPQGVQGEDSARFKLWLENCHHFRFGQCKEQLESYTTGRITLAQLFENQDRMISEISLAMHKKRMVGTSSSTQDDVNAPVQPTAGENNLDSADAAISTKPLTTSQKLKNAVKVYGSTVMVFHTSISLMSLGFFYTLVSSGIDVVGILSRLGIGETILQSKLATGTGTFVVAYAIHKVFAPARIAATLTATPLIVRYLRQIGFLKTPQKK